MSVGTAQIVEIARRFALEEAERHLTSLQSPEVAEILGRRLAAAFNAGDVDSVVVWDQVESAVLGHVVARELHADLVYAYSVEGALGLSAAPAPASRVVLVSYDWAEDPGLDALVAFVESRQLEVAGIGSVVMPTVLSGHHRSVVLDRSNAAPGPGESR
jgi:hypothetical protein